MPRTDIATRLIRAEPADIYAALVSGEARASWLPPEGMTGHIEHFDARPGGAYRMTLTYEDKAEAGKAADGTDIVEGRFVSFIEGREVVEEADFDSDDPAFAGTMTMTWRLAPQDFGTVVTIIASDVPDGISKADHDIGLNSSLANLAAFVGG